MGVSAGNAPVRSNAGCQRAGRDLARLDIGLIERVDADDGAGDRDGHFPAEELLTDVVDVSDRQSSPPAVPARSKASTAASCAGSAPESRRR